MRKAGMKAASIEDCLRDHVSMCRDLVEGREPGVGILTMRKHWRALKERYGEDGERRILERAQALTREIFGGAEPPPLANVKVDALSYVDADIAAERIAKEYRAAGVRPSKDPAWKNKLNQRFAALLKRHYAEIEQRAAAVERQEATIEIPTAQIEALIDASVNRAAAAAEQRRAAQSPTLPKVEEIVQTTVERLVTDRLASSSVRATLAGQELPLMTYAGVWREGRSYSPGMTATHDGVLWHCGLFTSEKPGRSQAWQLMHKSMEKSAK